MGRAHKGDRAMGLGTQCLEDKNKQNFVKDTSGYSSFFGQDQSPRGDQGRKRGCRWAWWDNADAEWREGHPGVCSSSRSQETCLQTQRPGPSHWERKE